jgi:hypothetical protein
VITERESGMDNADHLLREASQPDDIDDLIMHRATLHEMLGGSYWSGIGL